LGIIIGCWVGARRALLYRPSFYTAALATRDQDREQAGREFERNVLALHNDLRRRGTWKRVFSQDQINSWLALELPKKFPELLPPSVREPRVALEPGMVHVAFAYEDERWSTVIDLTLELALAAEPNTLAVRLRGARAGRIPLPLNRFLADISAAAAEADIALRWAQRDQDPVALISLGESDPQGKAPRTVVEFLEVGSGSLTLAGTTAAEGGRNRASGAGGGG
jgi:hypothetical protein